MLLLLGEDGYGEKLAEKLPAADPKRIKPFPDTSSEVVAYTVTMTISVC